MNGENILNKLKENIDSIIKRETPFGNDLWMALLEVHPVDIVDFLEDINRESARIIFADLPKHIKQAVFAEFSEPSKADYLIGLNESQQVDLLNSLSVDDLTDLFDYISDEDLKKYLNLIHKRQREKVISLMKFHPESAGGIMDIEVLSFMQDFTVEQSISILQRVGPRQEIYKEIYVTDKKNKLVGHISLEDLVLKKPKTRLSEFLRKNELAAQADEDQEAIVKKMVHYGLMTVPVIGKDNFFLGVIPSETLVDVIVEEASEDAQKMAALAPMKQSYFETPLLKLLWQRSYILVVLMLAESISTTVLHSYEGTLPPYLLFFITMLMSTGGNTSHQTSTLVVRGIASGDLHKGNSFKFLRREMITAFLLAVILGIVAFGRSFYTNNLLLESFVVALTIGTIVMTAVILGSFIPILLNRIKIDPAFSAGPFLATLMDILGVLIYCVLIKLLLF